MDYLIPMVGVGLVTSIHCISMCGGLVMTYAVKGEQTGDFKRRMLPHVAYQSAKIASYVFVGFLLGILGAFLDIGGIRGWVTMFAGLYMILLGINMTGRFPALNRLTPRPPKFLKSAIAKTRKKAASEAAEGESHISTPVTFGLLTGFMPCGPLQAAQLAAAGAGSAAAGALTMLGFGLGTAPLMLAFGAVSGYLGANMKKRLMSVAAIVIAVLGLVMLNRGAMLVGSPVTAQTIKQAVIGSPVSDDVTEIVRGDDGVAEITLVIEDVRFQPSTLTLPENEPVRLVVDRREDNACSDQIAMPQLGVFENLAPFATTVVEIPAAKAGSYTLTCGMGMMYGVVNVGSAAGGGASPGALLAIAGMLGALGYWFWRTRQPKPAELPAGAGRKPVPDVALLFGFTPQEVVVIAAALGAAIIAGLAFGGLFRY